VVARVTVVCSAPLVVAIVGLVLTRTSGAQSTEPRAWVTFPNGTKVSVEIAETEAVRARGLMFRETLAPDRGMLFLFEERLALVLDEEHADLARHLVARQSWDDRLDRSWHPAVHRRALPALLARR
jgi:hypothetical protein